MKTLLITMLVLGAGLRVYALDYPAQFIFDEHHFVENARNYLAHKADWNDHPPLGKLIIAGSMWVFGDQPAAWRLPALISGFLVIALGALATSRLFQSRLAGLIAGALLSADGFFIAYSRTALLDGLLAVAVVTTLLLTTLRWKRGHAVLVGVVVGSAFNVKFSGVGLCVPLLLALLLQDLSPWRRFEFIVVAAATGFVTYVSLYAAGLWLAGQPTGINEALRETRRLFDHHAGLTEMKHPYTSGWATWFVPLRAMVFIWSEQAGLTRVVTMLGNLATWWATTSLLTLTTVTVARLGVDQVLNPAPATDRSGLVRGFVLANGRAVLVLLAMAFGFLAPWMLSHRDSYLYHYLPSYTALVLLLAGFIGHLREERPRWALSFLCLVLAVAAIYAPLWSSIPLSRAGAEARLFFSGWR